MDKNLSTASHIVLPAEQVHELPPIIAGHESPVVVQKVESFYGSVAAMFDAWVERSGAYHTQRSYRRDVLNLIEFLGICWPRDSWRLLKTSVQDVRDWRAFMAEEQGYAPKTLNRRISSVSGFFQFMRETAATEKLPITVHNPAHKDFIKRPSTDPVDETKALSAANARKLISLPVGDSPLAARDRAILKFYIFVGPRIATGCRLEVHDFRWDEKNPTISMQEKGRGTSKRTVGINYEAADAINEYIRIADITSGPLFRARGNSRSEKLGARPIGLTAMYDLIMGYLKRLPGAMIEVELADGTTAQRCIYTPHSLRATTATLLLAAGEDITDVQNLLGHKHVTTTQIYDHRVRDTCHSASHRLRI